MAEIDQNHDGEIQMDEFVKTGGLYDHLTSYISDKHYLRKSNTDL